MSSEHEYNLLMPFVVVASVGGPYDDQSYVAGYEAGQFSQALELGADILVQTVRTNNVRQLDLIAMRFGFKLTAEDVGDGWSQIEARKSGVPRTEADEG